MVAMGLSFYLGGKLQAPEIITETETTETVTVDTAKVDSLYSVIERLESIPEEEQEETVIDTADVIDNVLGDQSREITTIHSDSLIVANNYLKMDIISGEITQTRFSYTLKKRWVRESKVEIFTTINTNITRETTTTRTIKEGMFFQAGILTNLDYFTPVIGVTTRSKVTFIYGYDPFTKTHTAGILAKF